MNKEKWRKEITELSNNDLLDELSRPTNDWNGDVIRESIYRILKEVLKSQEEKISKLEEALIKERKECDYWETEANDREKL